MAINIKFDLFGNPEPPTIVLANRNGNMLGQLDVDANSIDLSDKLNDASEFSFTLNKYVDGELTPLWDKVVDFKLVYCKEWDEWFEITVELDEATETVKTVYCTQLGQAELSQIMLYNIEINTESDIERDDYKIGILYDADHPEASILHRLLKDKAPHYSVAYVSPTITKIQRSFSFDGTSIYDAFQEIAEEIGCLFQFYAGIDENGVLQRKITVYDLQQTCNDCNHRGEFTDKCPKCGSTNITYGYGEDTLIFVTSDELASEGIQLTTHTDSVKNCFKLEAGDDLMTATVRNCNPNGTDYIWYFSDNMKEDMSEELVAKLESYDEIYQQYYNEHVSDLDAKLLSDYNSLVDTYSIYKEDLQKITSPIVGYSALMNAHYDTIDMALYLESGLMPSVEMSETSAEEQVKLLTTSALSPVAVNVDKLNSVSLATANSAVLSMAKVIVKSTYKVEIKTSTLSDEKVWSGQFIVTNYSDEEDVATSGTITVAINNDTETFIKQKIEKTLNKEDTDDLSISGLFNEEKYNYDEFCVELKKYALNPLKSFYDACDVCLNILIDQGAGNKDEKPDLYKNLYEPYYNKSLAIAAEIKIREDEIAIIKGVYDKTDENNPALIAKGLQTDIEEHRNAIQAALNFQNYLGEELWLDFCAYRREDKYSNDNYISDGLNNAEVFKKASEFLEVAENEIFKSAELQHSISTTLNNLLAIPKFKSLVDSFETGNWIRAQVDDRIYKLRLLEYDISFGDFNNISVEFSDITKIKNGITDVQGVFEQASAMATSYSSIQRQANQGDKAKTTLEEWIADGLNSANVQIQNNDSEDITFTKNGLLCRSYDDITDTYSPEQLKITHNIIAYTDDEWRTVRQAIGKHKYKFYDKNANDFIDEIGYGMSADFVTAGVVSGSQIIGGDIYSDNYSNIENEKSGSYLNLSDGTFSFAGGKLVYNGDDLSVDGKITIATEGTIGCWNVNKESIWKGSETFGNANGMYFGTDGLSLGDSFKVTSSGVATMTGADITGEIKATSGYIGDALNGFAIASTHISNGKTSYNETANNGIYLGTDGIGLGKGKFYVTNEGYLYSESGEIGGCSIANGVLQIKNANADGITADNVDITGTITATKGEIGGCSIVNGVLQIKNANIAENITASNINATNLKIAAGNITGQLTASQINADGITADNVDITGTITAEKGTIGGCSITNGVLQIKNANANGITAENVNITGTITAENGGKIGSWEIDNDSLVGNKTASSGHKVTLSPSKITVVENRDINTAVDISWYQLVVQAKKVPVLETQLAELGARVNKLENQ